MNKYLFNAYDILSQNISEDPPSSINELSSFHIYHVTASIEQTKTLSNRPEATILVNIQFKPLCDTGQRIYAYLTSQSLLIY